MSSLDVDINIEPFKQLEHRSIGYQSLTDVPQAIVYTEENIDFSVSLFFKQKHVPFRTL